MCGTTDQSDQPVEELTVDRLKQRAWLLYEDVPEMRKKIMRFKWGAEELMHLIKMKLQEDAHATKKETNTP